MVSGLALYIILAILTAWLALLIRTCWALSLKRRTAGRNSLRWRLTFAGMTLSAVAVGSLLLLHLTWVSPGVSQLLGVRTVSILSSLFVWPALAGLIFCSVGTGRIRFLGIGTLLVTGLLWLGLVMQSAISGGGSVASRHPTRFLIPDNYTGWVEVRYAEANANTLPIDNGTLICRIPDNGLLETSSPLESGWAKDEYFYYSKDGALHGLKSTGWGRGGEIWGEVNSATEQFFFVGTEQQFRSGVTTGREGPFRKAIPDPKYP
jgi:hypothetical protein